MKNVRSSYFGDGGRKSSSAGALVSCNQAPCKIGGTELGLHFHTSSVPQDSKSRTDPHMQRACHVLGQRALMSRSRATGNGLYTTAPWVLRGPFPQRLRRSWQQACHRTVQSGTGSALLAGSTASALRQPACQPVGTEFLHTFRQTDVNVANAAECSGIRPAHGGQPVKFRHACLLICEIVTPSAPAYTSLAPRLAAACRCWGPCPSRCCWALPETCACGGPGVPAKPPSPQKMAA